MPNHTGTYPAKPRRDGPCLRCLTSLRRTKRGRTSPAIPNPTLSHPARPRLTVPAMPFRTRPDRAMPRHTGQRQTCDTEPNRVVSYLTPPSQTCDTSPCPAVTGLTTPCLPCYARFLAAISRCKYHRAFSRSSIGSPFLPARDTYFTTLPKR